MHRPHEMSSNRLVRYQDTYDAVACRVCEKYRSLLAMIITAATDVATRSKIAVVNTTVVSHIPLPLQPKEKRLNFTILAAVLHI